MQHLPPRARPDPSIESAHSAASASASRVDTRARTNVDLLLVLLGRAAHALLDLARHGQKRLLDVGRVLGRRLEERDAQAICKLLISS
jgi:hypothetical protein